jgi:hypothetical protein
MKNELYLVNLETLERLPFQCVPSNIQIKRPTDISSIEIVGRNTHIYHNTGGAEEVSFKLDYFSVKENRRDVLESCLKLKALTYVEPRKKATKVMIVFGDLFSELETFIVKSIDFEISQFDQANMYPKQAYINITLALDPKKNLTPKQVRRYD